MLDLCNNRGKNDRLLIRPGFFGPAATHESLFGVLEYAPVIIALIVWAILPPGRFLGGMTVNNGVGGHTAEGEKGSSRFESEQGVVV